MCVSLTSNNLKHVFTYVCGSFVFCFLLQHDDMPFVQFRVFFLKIDSHVCVLSCFSCVQLFATLGTVACQAPLSMGFSRQEYWSGLSFPSPGVFLTQGWNLGL